LQQKQFGSAHHRGHQARPMHARDDAADVPHSGAQLLDLGVLAQCVVLGRNQNRRYVCINEFVYGIFYILYIFPLCVGIVLSLPACIPFRSLAGKRH
jgi:hypothetical protein